MNWGRWIAWMLWIATLVFQSALAQEQDTATTPAPQRKTSTPYTGDLTIFDYPERARKLHIQQVMDLLGIRPGATVADIGAGSGWFTVLAAKRVTPTGKVFAVDINPEAVAYVQKRAQKDGLSNITAIQGTADDPRLPTASIDAVLLLKTYHEIAKPVELMQNLRGALRANARVGIIDRNGSGENHGVPKVVALREMKSAGYRFAGEYDDLVKDDGMDYFLVFEAKPLLH